MLIRSVAWSSIILTLAVVIVTAALVLASGGSIGAAAAWAIVLAPATRVAPILGSFAIAYWPRSGDPLPPLGAVGLARVLAAESWATIRLFFYYHPFEALITRHEPEQVVAKQVPVVLVHGFYSNAGFWQRIKQALRAAGWQNLFTLNLEPLFVSIDEYARQLEARIDEACTRCGTQEAVVVGHSMGGIVARACARRAPARISRLVCVGSPHHGTVPASLVPSVTTRQMRRGSDWLEELNAVDPGVPLTCIYSEHDNIIVPQSSAALAGANNIPLHGVGHLEMAFSNALREALIRAVGTA